MSIIDNRKYIRTFHDFDIFKGCFGNSKIMPTDIDFLVERKNRFLCMEFKPEDKKTSLGQDILLRRLSLLTMFTVVLVSHQKSRTLHEPFIATAMQIYPDNKKIKINNEDLVFFVSSWYKRADSGCDVT